MSYELIHSRNTIHADSTGEEQAQIDAIGGICLGISIKWLEEIVVEGCRPDDAWPNVMESIELQRYFGDTPILISDCLFHTNLLFGRRTNYKVYREAIEDMWKNGGHYLVILPSMNMGSFSLNLRGHAYGFCKPDNSSLAYLFDPNYGVYVVRSVDGLFPCFCPADAGYWFCKFGRRIVLLEVSLNRPVFPHQSQSSVTVSRSKRHRRALIEQ